MQECNYLFSSYISLYCNTPGLTKILFNHTPTKAYSNTHPYRSVGSLRQSGCQGIQVDRHKKMQKSVDVSHSSLQ
jgi:hypothetical protein